MLKKIFILLLFILPQILFAQSENSFYKNQIKISPLRIIDLSDPGIELSYERLFSKRFSTQVSGSYDADLFGLFAFHGFHGYRFSLEEKYFLETTAAYNRKYISVDLVWNNNHYKHAVKYSDTTTNEIDVERFTIYRKTFSVNLKYGKQILYNRFIIDWCIGAGIKFRNVNSPNRTHPLPVSKGINFLNALTQTGKSTTFNLPVNIKIGYVF